MNSYLLRSDVSGTGLPGLSARTDMERAERDTGRKFNPQISWRWRWGHLDWLLQGTVKSSSVIDSSRSVWTLFVCRRYEMNIPTKMLDISLIQCTVLAGWRLQHWIWNLHREGSAGTSMSQDVFSCAVSQESMQRFSSKLLCVFKAQWMVLK